MKDIDGNERKKKTIGEMTLNEFMWKAIFWLLIRIAIAYGLIFLFFLLVTGLTEV